MFGGSVMVNLVRGDKESALPSNSDIFLAKEALSRLAEHFKALEHHRIRFLDESDRESETLELPPSVVRLLLDILDHVARGNAVRLLPIHAEVTTQQAATLLNVSRPHLVQLLEDREIPYRKVGTHRRVRAEDVFAYKRGINRERREVLQEIGAHDQELGLE
jgi:excisionase family DNA binding protein